MRMKPLLPTLKEKKRYILYEVLSKDNLSCNPTRELVKHINGVMGLFESAQAGVIPVRYDLTKQTGLLRVNNKYVQKLKLALALKKNVNDQPVCIQTLRVSGLLNKVGC